jgi:hypothetical protein
MSWTATVITARQHTHRSWVCQPVTPVKAMQLNAFDVVVLDEGRSADCILRTCENHPAHRRYRNCKRRTQCDDLMIDENDWHDRWRRDTPSCVIHDDSGKGRPTGLRHECRIATRLGAHRPS